MQIAVVHDYFTQMGGAERVAEELARMLPSASLYSTVAMPHLMPPGLAGRRVETSWMQHLPSMRAVLSPLLPLVPSGCAFT